MSGEAPCYMTGEVSDEPVLTRREERVRHSCTGANRVSRPARGLTTRELSRFNRRLCLPFKVPLGPRTNPANLSCLYLPSKMPLGSRTNPANLSSYILSPFDPVVLSAFGCPFPRGDTTSEDHSTPVDPTPKTPAPVEGEEGVSKRPSSGVNSVLSGEATQTFCFPRNGGTRSDVFVGETRPPMSFEAQTCSTCTTSSAACCWSSNV